MLGSTYRLSQRVVGLFGSALLGLLFSTAGSARAEVVFTPGNNPQQNEVNVLLNSGATGPTVSGQASSIMVQFSSTTDTLTEPSSGQARVEAMDGNVENLTISIPGGSFEDLIMNPVVGKASGGDATVTVVANEPGGGTMTFTFHYTGVNTLANGNNFLTIVASGGETLASVMIDAPGGFDDLRQPRISGAADSTIQPGPGVAPEPSSVMLLGAASVALVGYFWRRRR